MRREDHPWPCKLWGELSVGSIFSHQTQSGTVHNNRKRCTERRQTSWEGVPLTFDHPSRHHGMVEGGQSRTRMDFLTMATKSDPLGPVPLTVEREAQYCSGYRNTGQCRIARVHSP